MSYNELLYYTTFYSIITCWVIFALAFALKKKHKQAITKSYDVKAMIGVFIEASAYAIVWSFRRAEAFLIPDSGTILATIISCVAVIIAIGSVWMVIAAIQTLGKQWAIQARITEDHQLITTGP